MKLLIKSHDATRNNQIMTNTMPDLQELLARLVSAPSVSCTNASIDTSNKAVIELLDNWFSSLGFNTFIQTVDEATEKYNLIASIGQGQKGLVLAGHTDTVPCDDYLWQHDPFRLLNKDNRFYGLGIADMKAFFALIIEALRPLDLKKLQQPLVILATCDEETSMAGAKAIASPSQQTQNGILQTGLQHTRYAVIGEPTGLQPVRMHKGMMMQSIKLSGQAGHSSNPALGHNALEAMHAVISNLMQWRNELQQKYRNPLFEVPVPTLNFGHIHGGDNPNRICGHCELQIDIRPLPGMSVTDLSHELHQRLHELLSQEKIKIEITPLFDGVDAVETDANSELVKFIEQQTDTAAGAVAFGTEAPFYNAMGLQTMIMGPGDIAQAHQPDEYLSHKNIKPFIHTLDSLIKHFCM